MDFRISGLDPAPFRPLFGLGDAALARHGARRILADEAYSYPDRIELSDAEPGETLLLLNHIHQPADNPYRASHAIYVREGAERRYDSAGEIPDVLRRRLISLRAFDAQDEMIAAEVTEGSGLAGCIGSLFADGEASYLHAHFAKRGCYAARIDRI